MHQPLDAFLAPHTPWAYFMRSNIRRGGVDYQGQQYQADYFGVWRDDELCGLLAHSWIGSVQCFLPQTEACSTVDRLCGQTQLMRCAAQSSNVCSDQRRTSRRWNKLAVGGPRIFARNTDERATVYTRAY
jgi:hypothetical protein